MIPTRVHDEGKKALARVDAKSRVRGWSVGGVEAEEEGI